MIKKVTILLILITWPTAVWSQSAVFAGGSFWVMEALFTQQVGIHKVTVGWVLDKDQQPIRQGVLLDYDPELVSYGELLTLYWSAIDNADSQGQYCDRGREYSPAIYIDGPLQQRWAQQSRAQRALELKLRPLVPILPMRDFKVAPARHQRYFAQHPILYGLYRYYCGYPVRSGV